MGRQYSQDKEHLESLASIYSVEKERSSKIREALNAIFDNIDSDIISVSQTFHVQCNKYFCTLAYHSTIPIIILINFLKNLYPQLHQKIRSCDKSRVNAIIAHLHWQNNIVVDFGPRGRCPGGGKEISCLC